MIQLWVGFIFVSLNEWVLILRIVLGDSEILAAVCGFEEGGSEHQMSGFKFVNMANYGLKDESYVIDLFLYCSHEVIAMSKKMVCMLGMGLRNGEKRVVEFPNVKAQVTREGLGFFEGCDRIKKTMAL